MRYVLDACDALKWVLPEPDSAIALRLRDDFRNGIHELLAPDVFPAEVAHALAKAERRGVIPVASGARLLADVLRTMPQLYPSLPDLLPRAYMIASQARIGVYDCLYVALAEREGCELVTADDRLVRNLRARFPFIVPLASLP
jgi:predicted nucleic acid-binding protein